MNSKEQELDALKTRGDEISCKGNSSIVSSFEKQIFSRWDDLEKKLKYIESTLQMKLKEIERAENGPPPQKRQILEDEEVCYGHILFNYAVYCFVD